MQQSHRDTWTSLHDIALINIGLAYGTDHNLADQELDVIVKSIQQRQSGLSEVEAKTVVMDAVAVYLAGDSAGEIANSIQLLKATLSPAARQRTLDDLVRVAKSDGLLLGSERSMISVLAEAWDLRVSPDASEKKDLNSAIDIVAFLYIVVAHAGDDNISTPEIDVMISRLQMWKPSLDISDARAILRASLNYYSSEPTKEDYSALVQSLGELLPTAKLLSVLDDLNAIALADGELNEHETGIIHSLASAWNLVVRLKEPE